MKELGAKVEALLVAAAKSEVLTYSSGSGWTVAPQVRTGGERAEQGCQQYEFSEPNIKCWRAAGRLPYAGPLADVPVLLWSSLRCNAPGFLAMFFPQLPRPLVCRRPGVPHAVAPSRPSTAPSWMPLVPSSLARSGSDASKMDQEQVRVQECRWRCVVGQATHPG